MHTGKDGNKLKKRHTEKMKVSRGELWLDNTNKMQSPWQDYNRTTEEIIELGAGKSPEMDDLKDTSVQTVNTGIVIDKE